MTFAEKVKYVRGNLQLSQIQLAKELEVSNVTINRWERQGLRPSFLAEERYKMFCDKNNIKFEE